MEDQILTVADLLQKTEARVTYGNRWLVRAEDGEYFVYEHTYGQKKTRTIVNGADEATAVAALQEG